MRIESFKKAQEIILKIENLENQIKNRQLDIHCVEKKKYAPSIDCKVKVEFKTENGNSGYHNFILELSEESILKELRNQIFKRENQLFTLKKKLEQL